MYKLFYVTQVDGDGEFTVVIQGITENGTMLHINGPTVKSPFPPIGSGLITAINLLAANMDLELITVLPNEVKDNRASHVVIMKSKEPKP